MPIPQAMITTLPINIHVTIGLLVYGNGVPIQQPKRVNSYPRPSGKLSRGLPNRRLPKIGSPNQKPPRGLPPNPFVNFYGW